ncbi:hypothetical protein FE393_09930 [Xenorhabdus sp. psl]|nr:hypothetical protein [Xenorhabdus sp. psl]
MSDIIISLEHLKTIPLFSHIKEVTSTTPHIIDIFLHETDARFDFLMGSPHAMILPQEWQTLPNFSRHSIGTGPYQVVTIRENSKSRHSITILASEYYLMKLTY